MKIEIYNDNTLDDILEPTIINGVSYKIGKQLFVDFNLPYPVSNNVYYRRGLNCTYLSPQGKKFKEWVRNNYRCKNPENIYKGYLFASLKLLPKQKKDGTQYSKTLDQDNFSKGIYDSLKGIAFCDDDQIKDGRAYFGKPVKNGGVIVKLYELIPVEDKE
jgi:Holliday junction resolvase RusA-like endonuclease